MTPSPSRLDELDSDTIRKVLNWENSINTILSDEEKEMLAEALQHRRYLLFIAGLNTDTGRLSRYMNPVDFPYEDAVRIVHAFSRHVDKSYTQKSQTRVNNVEAVNAISDVGE